jgi:hypothetical protein
MAIRKSVSFALTIIIAHLAINYFHGAAHVTLSIGLSDWERYYVAIVILLAPLLAGIMLLSQFRRAGGWLLAASMAGALVFGIYKHFIAAGADNVFTLASSATSLQFQITAVLLAIFEAMGCWAGMRVAGDQSG